MSINVEATGYIYSHIRKNFVYDYTQTTNVSCITGSNKVTTNLNFFEIGSTKGDRIVITYGQNTFTSYIDSFLSENIIVLEDNLDFTTSEADLTVYIIPKLFKIFVEEKEVMPYGILSFVGRGDDKLFNDGIIRNIKFQINLYDSNSDDTDIENVSDEYIRIFNTLDFDDLPIRHCNFEFDTGIRPNKDKPDSSVILERAISFNLILK